jgi:hypothetical protein
MAVRDAAPTSAISTIHEHDRDLPSPIRPAPRGCPRGTASWVAQPLSGPDQPSFLGPGADAAFADRAPLAVIAHTEVGYPDPRDPDTFCRELVAASAPKSCCTTRFVSQDRSTYEVRPAVPAWPRTARDARSTCSETAGGAAPPGAR